MSINPEQQALWDHQPVGPNKPLTLKRIYDAISAIQKRAQAPMAVPVHPEHLRDNDTALMFVLSAEEPS